MLMLSLFILEFISMIQTLSVQLGFLLLACFWEFDFPPMMVLLIAILNDGKEHCYLLIRNVFRNMDINIFVTVVMTTAQEPS
jgi:hypothetical protein